MAVDTLRRVEAERLRPSRELAEPARYKPIPARAVAATLVRMAVERAPGRRIVESMEMRRFV